MAVSVVDLDMGQHGKPNLFLINPLLIMLIIDSDDNDRDHDIMSQ